MSTFSLIETAYSQAAVDPAKQPSMLEMLILPLGFLVIMYFFIIRPQAKKAKDHASLLTNLKVGDEVVTSGGIIGRVKSIAEAYVTIDVGGASLKVVKQHVSGLSKAPVNSQALRSKPEAVKS
jgi:preprotein translocase subunit YajC